MSPNCPECGVPVPRFSSNDYKHDCQPTPPFCTCNHATHPIGTSQEYPCAVHRVEATPPSRCTHPATQTCGPECQPPSRALLPCQHSGVQLFICQPMRFMWCRECGAFLAETIGGNTDEWSLPSRATRLTKGALVEEVAALCEEFHNGTVPDRHIEVHQAHTVDLIIALVRRACAEELRAWADERVGEGAHYTRQAADRIEGKR